MSRRSIYLLVVLLVAVGVVAYLYTTKETSSPGNAAEGHSNEPYGPLLEASEALRSGPQEISLDLAIDIPKGSESDNQDHQEISATGAVDYSSGQAELAYDFKGLNNAAGFLGHFDTMDVLYADGTGYLEIFQSGPAWVSIEPENAANGQVSRLRDVMLTSPVLLSGLVEAAAISPEGTEGETSREVVPSTLVDSDDQLVAGLGAAFEEVGVDSILVKSTLNDGGVSEVSVFFDYKVPEGRNEILAVYELAPAEGDVLVEIPSDSDTREFSDIFG